METLPLATACLYGPAESPRLGETLWINPLPIKYKLCSFNCLYCRLGPSDKIASDVTPYLEDIPSVDDVVATLKLRIEEGIDFDTLALSGNGEPTLHPEFPTLSKKIRNLLDEKYPGKTFCVLSNSSGLVREEVLQSIDFFDLPIFKFDVGKPSSFYRINRPDPNVVFEDIFTQLRKVGPKIHLQAVFVGGLRGNMNDAEIKMWIQAVADIRPKAVEIYSINKSLPQMGINVVPAVELEQLANRMEEETNVPVTAFGTWE